MLITEASGCMQYTGTTAAGSYSYEPLQNMCVTMCATAMCSRWLTRLHMVHTDSSTLWCSCVQHAAPHTLIFTCSYNHTCAHTFRTSGRDRSTTSVTSLLMSTWGDMDDGKTWQNDTKDDVLGCVITCRPPRTARLFPPGRLLHSVASESKSHVSQHTAAAALDVIENADHVFMSDTGDVVTHLFVLDDQRALLHLGRIQDVVDQLQQPLATQTHGGHGLWAQKHIPGI